MPFTQFNLAAPIISALKECNYNQLTPIQEQAIPRALEGIDLIATAQTGTGKTAAFVIPMLDLLQNTPKKGIPRVLILAPTRELVNQISDAIENKYGKHMKTRALKIVGGMPYPKQLRELKRPFDVLVATPGRLIDLVERRHVNFSAIEMLILDEADRMLDIGFIDDIRYIADQLPQERQTLLFSATFDKNLARLTDELLYKPERIDIIGNQMTLDNIEQRIYLADDKKHKYRLLHHIMTNQAVTQAIVFSNTKTATEELAKKLRSDGFEVSALHGDMRQRDREKRIAQLHAGKIQLLIATDVAARGIDVKDITHVFNFDLPRFTENYIHRIGRTGRGGQNGVAISFATLEERSLIQKIERFTKKLIEQHVIPTLAPQKQATFLAPAGKKKKKFNASKARKKSSKKSY
ncbi:MAG: DEAD/DEAH box helicase [Gammaproteobacteria bacterium]